MDGLAIAASLKEIREATEGGFVRSIYRPTRHALIVHVYAERNHRILIAPRHAAIHLTELDLPNPAKPGAFAMLLRRHLRGAKLIGIRQHGWDRVVSLEFERRDAREAQTYELVAELTGVRGNLHLLEGRRILGSAHRDRRNRPGEDYASLRPQGKDDPSRVTAERIAELLQSEAPVHALTRSIDGIGRRTAEDLLAGLTEAASPAEIHAGLRAILTHVEAPDAHAVADQGRATFYPVAIPTEAYATFWQALDAVSETVTETEGADEESSIRGELSRAVTRRKRTLDKLREWLESSEEADRLQSLADLLMIHHAEIAPKATDAVLTDPRTENEVTIRLVPSLSAIENAQRLYQRAKRLRRGRPHVNARIELLSAEVRLLESAIERHDREEEIDPSVFDLLPQKKGRGTATTGPESKHRLEIEGFRVRIGRNAKENDRLLRDAASDDLWLHAKGFAGSHVVIRRGGRREIPDSVVREAARLAAKHSKAVGERRVEVIVAEAKHVRKPKGSPSGLANVRKGDTLTVEMEGGP